MERIQAFLTGKEKDNKYSYTGGRIWIESEVGKGSRFVFIIPADGAPRTGS